MFCIHLMVTKTCMSNYYITPDVFQSASVKEEMTNASLC